MIFLYPYWWARAYPFVLVFSMLGVLVPFCPLAHGGWWNGLGGFSAGALIACLVFRPKKIQERSTLPE